MKNFNKVVLLLITLLIILTLQGVSAIDNDNLAQELQSGDIEVLGESENSFTQLQSLIDGGNATINLEKDYIQYDGEKTIKISRNVTINGNGHIIDANYNIQALLISADNVVLNNITVKNGNNKLGGAINWQGANGVLANSSFINNNATGTDTATNYEGGGAVYWIGNNGLIANSTFESNSAGGHGGAIWWSGNDGIIENSVFERNIASKWGGAVYSKGTNVLIRNGNFTGNKGSNGGSISIIGEGSSIDNLIFDLSNGTLGGALYWNVKNGVIKNSKFYNSYGSGSTGGGAIYITSSATLTTIEHCDFINNTAAVSGGAIYAYSKAIVNDCHFYNNGALNFGGAIFFNAESSEVNSSEFINNKVSKSGGAVYITNRFSIVNNSIFKNNTAEYAGAVYFSSYKHKLNNTLFEGNNATADGGAVYLGSYGTIVDNATFISNSAVRGGALYNYVTGTTVTTKTEIINSDFKYNNAVAGGAVASFAKFIGIDSTDFTFNKASYGAAIYMDRTSYTISNSTFLDNSADSVKLTLNLDESDYTASAVYTVNNTLLNAIYRIEGSVLLENVTYWGENGISNSDDGYIEDIYAINQNITLIVKDNTTSVIYNITNQTRIGNVIFKDLLFKPGKYTLQAIHYEDNYYTEIASNIETLTIDGVFSKLELVNDTIFYGENALVRTSYNATGNVSIFIGKYYTAEIDHGLANISLEGLACGTYGALITYTGDDYYDASGFATQIKIIENSPGAYSYLKTEYANTVQAGINNTLSLTVENTGIKSGKNVKIRVLSENIEIADFDVEDYETGQYYKFSFIDPILRPLDESSVFNVTHKLANYTIIVEDGSGLINSTNFTFPIIYNGYLGKDYEYPQEFNDKITRIYDITGDVIIVNSPYTKYASSTDTYRVENFTVDYRNDVAEALLYVPYNWDNIETGDYNRWHAVFNNGFITPIAHYRDQANLGGYGNRGYGLVVYNVTEFVKSDNNIFELTKVRSGCAVYPSSLMVLTNNSLASTIKKVYITENADLLSKQYSLNSTVGELTELNNINNAFMIKSDLYVFAASAEPDEGNIIFNGNNITNVWEGNSSSLEMFKTDITKDLAKENTLFFEATGGTILSLHKIIVVESQLNVSYSAKLKTEYTNTVQAGVNNTLTLTVVNNGTDSKKNVSVKVLSEDAEIASFIIENYVPGNDNIFTLTDCTIRPINENTVFGADNVLANYTVIVDDAEFKFAYPVRYNGNLGKDYAYPKVNYSEITREYEIDGEMSVITSPDSMYMKSDSTINSDVFNVNASDIVEALLYVAYNWDNVADGDYLTWNVTVNDNLVNPIAHYRDQGNMGNYGNRGYGLVVYNVTEFVKSGENNYALNKNSGGCAVYPYSLIVLTNDTSSNVIKKVYISENADLLSKTNNKALAVEAKTLFEGVDLTNSTKSNLYVFAASAQNGEGNIIFNDVTEENIWNGSSNSLAVYSLDVEDIIAENNNVVFESTGATILALHQMIVVESPKPKEDLNISATAEPITVGEDAVIVVSGLEYATGNVTVTVEEGIYTAPIVNGTASVVVPELVKNITADVTYDGDDRYNNASTSVDIVVNPKAKENATISVDAPGEVTAGENVTVCVTLPEDATGNVTVGDEVVPVVNGTASAVLANLPLGNTTVPVTYSGDDKYNPIETNITVTVNEKPAPEPKENLTIEASADPITVGEDAIIIVTGLENATGNVTVTVEDGIYTAPIVNGTASVVVPGLVKNITADVTYDGDDRYNNASTSVDIVVSPKTKENATISVDAPSEVIEGENVTVCVTLPEDATGNVTVGDEVVPVVNGTASAVLANLPLGNTTVPITYSGDDKYNPIESNVTISVKEDATVIISAPDVTKYFHGFERFVVNVTDKKGNPIANKSVSIVLNGQSYTRTTNANGTTSVALNLAAGVYNATTTVDNNTINSVVTILTTVNGTDLVKVFRNATQYYATFLDTNGNYLAEGTAVRFNINGVMYDRKVTGDKGLAKLNINLQQGEYIITAMNLETGENAANNITVISRITENSDLTKYYRNASQYTVKLIGDDGKPVGAGENVTFNINGVMYTRTTNASGIAKMNINLAAGDYIITAEYKGCKVSNNITVLPVLTAKDISMKYRDGSQFVATLVDGQGKAYAGQSITFNINGVFYTRTTDDKGQAKLNIRLMAGEYIITSSYNGSNIANTIKISG